VSNLVQKNLARTQSRRTLPASLMKKTDD